MPPRLPPSSSTRPPANAPADKAPESPSCSGRPATFGARASLPSAAPRIRLPSRRGQTYNSMQSAATSSMSKQHQPFAQTEPSSPQPGHSLIGQTISHYRVTEKLGAGGMGVVYKALDTNLERTVALKFLPENVTVSSGDKTNLQREARAACNLDHPNIGVIHGLEETFDGHLFIVMQYHDGETLAQRIARGPLAARESLDLAIQIASGLTAAHARNIVHRDI